MAQCTACLWGAQGVKATNGCIMTMWKTNFNMPAPNLFTGGDCWDSGKVCAFYGTSMSYDFSSMNRGYEAWQGVSMQRYCVANGESLNGVICGCLKFTYPDNSLLYGSSYSQAINITAPESGYYWQYVQYFLNVGVASWEISGDGNYCLCLSTTCVSGDDLSIPNVTCQMPASNVPGTVSTGSIKGVIWVEGNNLNFRPAQSTDLFEHSMAGDCQGNGGTPGAIWIDTTHYLNWVNASGDIYKAKWRICQFCSWFGNSAGPNPAPGASYAGAIWADGEFGYSHLAYIGCDGNKYLTGAGNCPYIAP